MFDTAIQYAIIATLQSSKSYDTSVQVQFSQCLFLDVITFAKQSRSMDQPVYCRVHGNSKALQSYMQDLATLELSVACAYLALESHHHHAQVNYANHAFWLCSFIPRHHLPSYRCMIKPYDCHLCTLTHVTIRHICTLYQSQDDLKTYYYCMQEGH